MKLKILDCGIKSQHDIDRVTKQILDDYKSYPEESLFRLACLKTLAKINDTNISQINKDEIESLLILNALSKNDNI